MRLTAKFLGGEGAKLQIRAKEAKRGGFLVSASLKTVGERAVPGCRASFASETEATAKFEEMKSTALKQGWQPIVAPVRAGSFDVIPVAPGFRNGKKNAA